MLSIRSICVYATEISTIAYQHKMDKRVVNQKRQKKKTQTWLNSENENEIEPDHDRRRIGKFFRVFKMEMKCEE